MEKLAARLRDVLHACGADIVGFGDIREVDAHERHDMPVGVVIAIKYPKEVIRGISEAPTPQYRAYYDSINEQLDKAVTAGAQLLAAEGYRALAQTRQFVGSWEPRIRVDLPHKTIATRAGIGWIGKCALLVTQRFGSAIRLSSILTDAPLPTAEPVDASRCGGCKICTQACPGRAVRGVNWRVGLPREAYFDAPACRNEARKRSIEHLGEDVTICGKCIEVCPYTRAYTALSQE